MDNNDLVILSKKVSKFVTGFEGNISKKENNKIIIKPSGRRLDSIIESDFISYDLNLKQLDNLDKKGSMEIDFHSYLLSFEEIKYVCHTHPINTLKIVCSDKINFFAEKRFFPDQVIFNGEKSLIIPYVKPGIGLMKYIKSGLNKWFTKFNTLPKIILLENHGLITFGKTIEECVLKTEICEKSAEILLGTESIGKIKTFTKKQIKELLNDNKEKYRLNNL
jgi:ribulose-5-phosphate 4-epimerase/fuculose-1-phosphate aldolase